MVLRPVLPHQRRLWVVVVADDVDHAVEVQKGGDEAFQHFEAVVDLVEPVLRAALKHFAAVGEEGAQHLLQRGDLGGHTVDQHVHVQAEPALQIGVPVEHVHQDFRFHVTGARLQHDADVLGTLVAHVGEDRDLLGLDRLGDLLDQAGFLHLIGDLGDDDLPLAAPQILDFPARAGAEAAATGAIGLRNGLGRFDDGPAGGEIGAFDIVQQRVVTDPFGIVRLGEVDAGVAKLADIVRRDVGGHADGYTGRAVGKQVREGGRQDDGLVKAAVIVGSEIDGILVEAFQQRLGHGRHAGLGVAAGGGVVAVDIAEVPLPVDQWIADVEVLREPGHRVIDRAVAVGVEIAHRVAGDLGGFQETARGRQPQARHRVKDSPMNRLQTVAHIGKRPVHDRGKRISEVPVADSAAQGLGEVSSLHLGVVRGVTHRCCISGGLKGGKAETGMKATAKFSP